MPFHSAVFSLPPEYQKTPSSLCLKQMQLCSESLLDASPVNPLSVFSHKRVIDGARGREKGSPCKQPTKAACRVKERLVIITTPGVCGSVRKETFNTGFTVCVLAAEKKKSQDSTVIICCFPFHCSTLQIG